MFKYLFNLGLVAFLFSCSGNSEKISLDLTPEEIDAYVANKLDSSQIYDITRGMRFSKADTYAYSSVRFSQNDTAILYTETEEEITGITYRNLYFKEGLPVFVEEHITKTDASGTITIERKVYLNGAIILKALERSAPSEEELEAQPFKEITMTVGQFDFERAENSINQTDDYEMKFGEFLVVYPATYLILDNYESGFSVALYLSQGDELINELYANPDAYQGRAIGLYYEFVFMNGMEQMVYAGGILSEKKKGS